MPVTGARILVKSIHSQPEINAELKELKFLVVLTMLIESSINKIIIL